MRSGHTTIGGRHLVRLEGPGGVRNQFRASGEARKADWPSGLMAIGRADGLARPEERTPAGGPASESERAAREAENLTPFPSMAEIRRRSDEATAEIFRPLNPLILGTALAALVLAAAFTTVTLAQLDRQIAITDRV